MGPHQKPSTQVFCTTLVICAMVYIFLSFTDLPLTRFVVHQRNQSKILVAYPVRVPDPVLLCTPKESDSARLCLCYLDQSTASNNNISDHFQVSELDNRTLSAVKCGMTISTGGRLGNYMGKYAALYALAKINRRPAFITEEMASVLRKYFKISLPVISKRFMQMLKTTITQWETVWLHDWMEPFYSNFTGLFVYLNGYPCSWTFYDHIREEIQREFTFHEHIVTKAQRKLWALRGNRSTVTYVGVHIRRTDYVHLMNGYYKGKVADDQFLRKATDHFRGRYHDAIFVVTSDDLQWCRANMDGSRKDVYFLGNNNITNPIQDLALLAQCNHSIITVGTYGYWSAYLAGGEAVYLHNFLNLDSPFLNVMKYNASFLPEWIPIDANLTTIPKLHTSTPTLQTSMSKLMTSKPKAQKHT